MSRSWISRRSKSKTHLELAHPILGLAQELAVIFEAHW
jgi:hypothetical protein